MRYDAIVVGARCAGSATAMLLARKGHKVLVVDRATFPSDTMSTHWAQLAGLSRLDRWGLLGRLEKTTAPPMPGMTLDFGPFAITGTPPPSGHITHSYCPRRIVLDQILVDAAVESGAELREAFTVDELVWDDGRVVGITGHGRGGRQVTENASIVIGADGLHSVVAREVKAPTYNEIEPRTCLYYSYWSGLDFGDSPVFRIRPGLGVPTFPTNDGLTLVGVGRTAAEFPAFRRDVKGQFDRGLAEVGLLDQVSRGKQEERFVGTADFPNFFRVPYGPGWALAGDAGYHKDSITAQGIADAFRDADLVADAVHSGLSGDRRLEDALADYQRERDDASMPMYGFTTDLAKLEPPSPEQAALFQALAGSPEHANRLAGVFAGTVSVPEFFSPDSIGSILAAAA